MSTATAEPVVAQKSEGVIFLSRRSELWLAIDRGVPVYGPGGIKVDEGPLRMVEFRDGRYVLTAEEAERFERPFDEMLALLERHPRFKDPADGFWRVEALAPAVTQQEIEAITGALLDGDIDMLERIVVDEEAGWARPELLGPATKARDGARKLLAQQEALSAEELAREQAAEQARAQVREQDAKGR